MTEPTSSFLPPPLPDAVSSDRFWDPSKIKDDTQEYVRLCGTYATGHSARGWRYWTQNNVPVYSLTRPTEMPNVKMRADRTTGEMRPDYPQEVLLLVGFVAGCSGFRMIEVTQKSLLREMAAFGADPSLTFDEHGLASWVWKVEKNTRINPAVATYLSWSFPNKPASDAMRSAWLEFAPTVRPANRLINLSPFSSPAPPLPDVEGAGGDDAAGAFGEDLATAAVEDLPEGL